MDLAKIKRLVKQSGDKIILMEGDEPELVVMSFAEYERLKGGEYHHQEILRPQRYEDGALGIGDLAREGYEETEFAPYHPAGTHARVRDKRPRDRDPLGSELIAEEDDLGFTGPHLASSRMLSARLEDIRLEDLPL